MTMQMCDIAKCIGATVLENMTITDISTDSRTVQPGSVFIAIKGERFDGHDFVEKALANGACYAIVQEDRAYHSDRIIKVEDTLKAYLKIASCYRDQFSLKMVAVTGSVGKTSTKEMIYAVMSEKYNTLKTIGNFNNEIGFPKMLLMLDKSYQAAVLEMGMSGFGEIEELVLAAKPDIGVITNIGVSHIGLLGSRENIKKAKLEITKGLKDNSPLILCGDNDLLQDYKNQRLHVIKYGIDNLQCDILAGQIYEEGANTFFTIFYQGQKYSAKIPTIGKHNVYNALAAFAVGMQLGLTAEACICGMEHYQTTGMRQNFVKHHGFIVVEDCYNASPDSMRAAIDTLSTMPGRKICILSDMLELGEYAQKLHYEIGCYAGKKKIDALLCFGKEAKQYVLGANACGMQNAKYFCSKAELFAYLKQTTQNGDVLWFKASHSMNLEEVVNKVYSEM